MDNLCKLFKYVVEGLVVGLVVFLTTAGKLDLNTLAKITLVASLSFSFLDFFAPKLASSARFGSGFGVGMGQVGGNGSNTSNGLGSNGNTRLGVADNAAKTTFSLESSETCGNTETSDTETSNLKPEIIQEINLTPVPNNVGACQMKPYLNDVKRAEAFAEVLEESDDIMQIDPVITETPAGKCPHMPYKIIPGQWSEEALIAGYNESVTAANACTGYWTGF